jgi:hypothetical protein
MASLAVEEFIGQACGVCETTPHGETVRHPWKKLRTVFGTKGPSNNKRSKDRCRGARMTRREEGAYPLRYVTDEQRNQPGCTGAETGTVILGRALSTERRAQCSRHGNSFFRQSS